MEAKMSQAEVVRLLEPVIRWSVKREEIVSGL